MRLPVGSLARADGPPPAERPASVPAPACCASCADGAVSRACAPCAAEVPVSSSGTSTFRRERSGNGIGYDEFVPGSAAEPRAGTSAQGDAARNGGTFSPGGSDADRDAHGRAHVSAPEPVPELELSFARPRASAAHVRTQPVHLDLPSNRAASGAAVISPVRAALVQNMGTDSARPLNGGSIEFRRGPQLDAEAQRMDCTEQAAAREVAGPAHRASSASEPRLHRNAASLAADTCSADDDTAPSVCIESALRSGSGAMAGSSPDSGDSLRGTDGAAAGSEQGSGGGLPANHINTILGCNFGVMRVLGRRVMRPFLMDRFLFWPLAASMTGALLPPGSASRRRVPTAWQRGQARARICKCSTLSSVRTQWVAARHSSLLDVCGSHDTLTTCIFIVPAVHLLSAP